MTFFSAFSTEMRLAYSCGVVCTPPPPPPPRYRLAENIRKFRNRFYVAHIVPCFAISLKSPRFLAVLSKNVLFTLVFLRNSDSAEISTMDDYRCL